MSKKARKERQAPVPVTAEPTAAPARTNPHLIPLAALAAMVAVFYWIPLTSRNATIHWDAVDVHYSALKYFAEAIRAGNWPSWTPYVFSGFPFLSDIQNGVWYPLNWPLFLIGVTPGTLQLSLAVHCLLGAWGMYFFTRRFVQSSEAAVVGALLYAFCGFFAGHSSHVGMFQTAALLPLFLLALQRAFENGRALYIAVAGLVLGVMILAGHFQTALYSCLAAALFAIATLIRDRGLVRHVVPALVLSVLAGVLVSCVQFLPATELVRNSVRARQVFSASTDAPLQAGTLATMLHPNALGAISGSYSGPGDVTQFHFYAGLLLLPLAAFGLWNHPIRLAALLLILPSLWYALGPAGGLYRVISLLPGFANVRGPVHVWFVAAFALALLAGAGLDAVVRQFGAKPLVAWSIIAVAFVDVFYWNSLNNPLAYERASFQESYGAGLELLRTQIAPNVPALARLHLPPATPTFGPMNHPLDAKIETTYGYNPLQLAAYADYIAMADTNARLLDTLSVQFRSLPNSDGIHKNPSALPRVTFPRTVKAVASAEAAKAELAQLNPAEQAVITESSAPAQDPTATASIADYGETRFRVHYRSGTAGLLRIGMPFYPGWRASVDGKQLSVIPVDYALSGVVVPAGEHDLLLEFHTPLQGLGAALSGVAVLTCIGIMVWDVRRRSLLGSEA